MDVGSHHSSAHRLLAVREEDLDALVGGFLGSDHWASIVDLRFVGVAVCTGCSASRFYTTFLGVPRLPQLWQWPWNFLFSPFSPFQFFWVPHSSFVYGPFLNRTRKPGGVSFGEPGFFPVEGCVVLSFRPLSLLFPKLCAWDLVSHCMLVWTSGVAVSPGSWSSSHGVEVVCAPSDPLPEFQLVIPALEQESGVGVLPDQCLGRGGVPFCASPYSAGAHLPWTPLCFFFGGVDKTWIVLSRSGMPNFCSVFAMPSLNTLFFISSTMSCVWLSFFFSLQMIFSTSFKSSFSSASMSSSSFLLTWSSQFSPLTRFYKLWNSRCFQREIFLSIERCIQHFCWWLRKCFPAHF